MKRSALKEVYVKTFSIPFTSSILFTFSFLSANEEMLSSCKELSERNRYVSL